VDVLDGEELLAVVVEEDDRGRWEYALGPSLEE
jgi:hypothetical protein